MITKTRRVYVCEFCGRTVLTKATMTRHEPHCFKNPGRIPREGEQTAWVWLCKHDYRWRRRLEGSFPEWWPRDREAPHYGCGQQWDGRQWKPIKGYKLIWETVYHTMPGEPHLLEPDYDTLVDVWPRDKLLHPAKIAFEY